MVSELETAPVPESARRAERTEKPKQKLCLRLGSVYVAPPKTEPRVPAFRPTLRPDRLAMLARLELGERVRSALGSAEGVPFTEGRHKGGAGTERPSNKLVWGLLRWRHIRYRRTKALFDPLLGFQARGDRLSSRWLAARASLGPAELGQEQVGSGSTRTSSTARLALRGRHSRSSSGRLRNGANRSPRSCAGPSTPTCGGRSHEPVVRADR